MSRTVIYVKRFSGESSSCYEYLLFQNVIPINLTCPTCHCWMSPIFSVYFPYFLMRFFSFLVFCIPSAFLVIWSLCFVSQFGALSFSWFPLFLLFIVILLLFPDYIFKSWHTYELWYTWLTSHFIVKWNCEVHFLQC